MIGIDESITHASDLIPNFLISSDALIISHAFYAVRNQARLFAQGLRD
jgi:hypothetical protein